MKTAYAIIAIPAASIILSICDGAKAEVVGPLLERSTMELGCQSTNIIRTMGPESSTMKLDTGDFTFVGRYGLTHNMTMSWELYTGNLGFYHSDKDNLTFHTLGIGASFLIWEKGDMKIHAGTYFKETFCFETSGPNREEKRRSYTNMILFEKPFEFAGITAFLWGGPGFYKYSIFQSFVRDGKNRESLYHWGFTVGVSLILWEHMNLYTSFNHVDSYEPRLGLMYRF